MTATVPLLKTEPRFSIIIPAHNEEDRIERTLEQYARTFADSEIIVALNGCTDTTAQVVERVAALHSNIRYVEIAETIGKGGAIRAGFMLAGAPVVGYADADGATAAAEMRRLCESLGTVDGVIASRWMPGAAIDVKQTLLRRAASRTFNFVVRALFGLRYTDTQCGAKVFTKRSLEEAMRYVETSNLAFDVDLLFVMKSLGFRVREEPTFWNDVEGSRLRLGAASRLMLAAVIRLRLRYSILRLIVPIYDRLFPTRPVRAKDRYNILILNWRDPKHPQAGGAEKYLFEQAKRWLHRGHYVEWLSGGFAGGAARDSIDSIPIRRVGNAVTVYAAVPWTYVTEFRDRFDIVLDAENGLPFFSPLYSLKPKLCIVHHVHLDVFRNHLPKWLAYPLMACERTIVPMVYRNVPFVTVSEDTRAEMKAIGMSKRPVSIVYNGVDDDLTPGAKATAPTVLYFGRLMAYKRVDRLIEAFGKVKASVPEAHLIIAGAGPAKQALEKCVERLGLMTCVTFEGFVGDARKRELLQHAWILVNPSEIEGWGVSVIEANACGTAAIAYDVPGLRESIRHDQTGLVVSKDGDLAASIVTLLRDGALRERLERGAIAWARNFSWDKSAGNMLKEMDKAVVGFDRGLVEAKR